jgi:preprotein translocase subunit SecA
MFAALLDRVKFETVSMLSKVSIRTQEEVDREEEERRERLMRALQAQHAEMASLLTPGEQGQGQAGPGAPQGMPQQAATAGALPQGDAQGTFVRGDRKVGRNEPCPCGSGKKYKHCHGALTSVE